MASFNVFGNKVSLWAMLRCPKLAVPHDIFCHLFYRIVKSQFLAGRKLTDHRMIPSLEEQDPENESEQCNE